MHIINGAQQPFAFLNNIADEGVVLATTIYVYIGNVENGVGCNWVGQGHTEKQMRQVRHVVRM